jgi:hypothetical protein
MKTIHILGTSPEIKDYKPVQGIERIGVNDIFKYQPCEYLLVMDSIDSFTPERLKAIEKSTPSVFYSTLDEWRKYSTCFVKIECNPIGGDISTLDEFGCIPRHVDSTFTAACMAYVLGAKTIILYGVMFFDHHLMAYSEQILNTYEALAHELFMRNVILKVGSQKSLLARVLPVHNN